jgi:hypothetical protein
MASQMQLAHSVSIGGAMHAPVQSCNEPPWQKPLHVHVSLSVQNLWSSHGVPMDNMHWSLQQSAEHGGFMPPLTHVPLASTSHCSPSSSTPSPQKPQ